VSERRGEQKQTEPERKGLAGTAMRADRGESARGCEGEERGRGDLTRVGWLRRRGFPNCAVSLSVIDRFAGTINTRRTRLSLPPRRTPPSAPALAQSSVLDQPPTYSSFPLSPRPSSRLRLNHPTTVYRVALAIPLRRCLPSSFLIAPSLIPSTSEGRKTLTFKRASEGEHGVLSILPLLSLSLSQRSSFSPSSASSVASFLFPTGSLSCTVCSE